MKLRRAKGAKLACWGLVSFAFTTSGGAQNAQLTLTQGTPFEVASRHLQEAVDQGISPGAGLWFSEPGTGALAAYFGHYHSETRISIDSASQWLVAATVMTLIDDQKTTLDEPIGKFFPGLEEEKAALTLRQLLAHKSGLPAHHPCLADPTSTLAQCAQTILEASLSHDPGTEVRFGFGSYQVVGRIAEILAEAPWEDVFQSRLAEPLGMASTGFGDHSNPRVGAGAFTSLEDYGKFLSELLAAREGRGKVLSARSAGKLLANQMEDAVSISETRQTHDLVALGSWIDSSSQTAAEERFSNPAIFGFTPWLEVSAKTAGIVLILAEPDEALTLVGQIRADLTPPAATESETQSVTP